jgi:hypothetical protein
VIIAVAVLLSCSEDATAPEETITQPTIPDGPADAVVGAASTYKTSATSNLGHVLQYRFDLDPEGATDYTPWSLADSISVIWPDTGRYALKAQARCAEHTDKFSPWSNAKYVGADVEIVTMPYGPTGDDPVQPTMPGSYCTGIATSSRGHPIEYQWDFDFNALAPNDTSAWDTTTCVTHSWPTIGWYTIRNRARCAIHPEIVSSWSPGLTIRVRVDELPEIRFATHIDQFSKPYQHQEVPSDTVGMFKPFSLSYHGMTSLGSVAGYLFFPLTTGVDLPGANEWSTDLADTIRSFPNTGPDALPSGVFRLAAKCSTDVGALSVVDAGSFERGVCQVVVNYDPDTRIVGVNNSYTVDDVQYNRSIDFMDAIPDTVPFYSWVRIDYEGWDDSRDDKLCASTDPNGCLGFQVAYYKSSVFEPGAQEFSLFQPRGHVQDTDPYSAADSNSFNMASIEYDLYARTVDENGRPDGSPAGVPIVGNYDPTLDSLVVEDHLGNRIDITTIDTITWNFWKGEGWPYICICDTVDFEQAFCGQCGGREYPDNQGTYDYYKSFSFRVKAYGHDHALDPTPTPKNPDGSAIKAWQYMIENSQGQYLNLGRAQKGWFEGSELDVLDEVVRWRVYYPGLLDPNPDPNGDTVFANLPSWLDDDITFYLLGRDTGKNEPDFSQYIFVNGSPSLLNVFPVSALGRRTQERVFTFRIQLVR